MPDKKEKGTTAMIEITELRVFNMEGAIRGMRNPLNSHIHSDSAIRLSATSQLILGEKDTELALKLIRGGSEHRKFLRQIFVSMDINAPLYWWKEMDTYKVSTTANSESTMHTITKTPFHIEQFSHEHLDECDGEEFHFKEVMFGDDIGWPPASILQHIISALNFYRQGYVKAVEDKNLDLAKKFWWQIIQLLPTSWNQKRTWTGSYENILNILPNRSGHKQDEWRNFCHTLLADLPYLAMFYEAASERKG